MPNDFKPGQVVKLHRPNRELHGTLARFMEAAPDAFGWVSISTENPLAPPSESDYRKKAKHLHRLFPLSQILPHEPAS